TAKGAIGFDGSVSVMVGARYREAGYARGKAISRTRRRVDCRHPIALGDRRLRPTVRRPRPACKPQQIETVAKGAFRPDDALARDVRPAERGIRCSDGLADGALKVLV